MLLNSMSLQVLKPQNFFKFKHFKAKVNASVPLAQLTAYLDLQI